MVTMQPGRSPAGLVAACGNTANVERRCLRVIACCRAARSATVVAALTSMAMASPEWTPSRCCSAAWMDLTGNTCGWQGSQFQPAATQQQLVVCPPASGINGMNLVCRPANDEMTKLRSCEECRSSRFRPLAACGPCRSGFRWPVRGLGRQRPANSRYHLRQRRRDRYACYDVATVRAMAQQPDGKLVIAASLHPQSVVNPVLRSDLCKTDGSLGPCVRQQRARPHQPDQRWRLWYHPNAIAIKHPGAGQLHRCWQ